MFVSNTRRSSSSDDSEIGSRPRARPAALTRMSAGPASSTNRWELALVNGPEDAHLRSRLVLVGKERGVDGHVVRLREPWHDGGLSDHPLRRGSERAERGLARARLRQQTAHPGLRGIRVPEDEPN